MLRGLFIAAIATAPAVGESATSAKAAEVVWHSAAPMPVANAGFAHGVIDDHLVIAGGTTWEQGIKRVLTRSWTFSPAQNRWTELRALPRAFAFGGFGVVDGELYLLSGYDGARTRSDGFALSLSRGVRCFQVAPAAYAGAAADGLALYRLGGTPNLSDLSRLTAHFERHDRAGAIERLPDFPGGAVLHAALVALHGNIYVFPGGKYDAARHVATNTRGAWRYDPPTRTWTGLAPYPFAVRGLGACAINERFILVGGGFKTAAAGSPAVLTSACYLYDTATDRYVSAPALPYAAMLVGFEKVGGSIYAMGGEDGDRHRSAAVHCAQIAALLEAPPPSASGVSGTR